MMEPREEKEAMLEKLEDVAKHIDPENCVLIAMSPADEDGRRSVHVYRFLSEAFKNALITISNNNFEVQKQLREVYGFLSEAVGQTQVSEFDPTGYL